MHSPSILGTNIMAASNEQPLGPAPELSVGFSDSVLLIVSIVGSIFLAYTVHSIVYTKLKSAEEIEEEELTYDEQLVNADVSTLNRAQRRARARQIMKQERRMAPASAAPTDGEGNLIAEAENPIPTNTAPHLSRKERQKAAKAAEREQRKLFEEDRRREQAEAQKIAQREKQEREKRLKQQAKEERKERQERAVAEEMTAYKKWKIFLESPNGEASLTVLEWIRELEGNRYARIDNLAKRFQVDTKVVNSRIQGLIKESRVAGLHDDNLFIFLSMEEMAKLAEIVKSRKKISAQDVREILTTIITD